MGAGASSEAVTYYDLTTNDYLLLFAGELPITNNDPFWESFLTFTLKTPNTREVDELITKQLKLVYKTLLANNLKTGNFATLINYISKNATASALTQSSSESDNVNLIRCRCFNALFIVRCFLKYLIEHTTDEDLSKHFQVSTETYVDNNVPYKGFQRYIQTLVDLVIKLPVNDNTYEIHLEAINSLLVVLSSPLFTATKVNQLTAYKILMELPGANNLMKILIQKYIEQSKRPSKSSGGIFYGLASDIFNFFSFGKGSEENSQCSLGNQAVLLMLVLINHCNSSSNPYRLAISSYTANVNGLYEVLYQTIHSEENTLLLYHLLHCNINFKNYLLARSDIELMLLPILKRIYFAADSNCHHMYMSLIILLILTEDQLFNKTVHSMMLKGISWYTERMITEISLGGLIILVTTRTIQYNLLRMRDKYLHTNCLAALANMSSQFSNLHPYVCQRLISLFEILSKTHSRANVDVLAVEEAIRIILEVINSCLTHQLIHNTNLVYTLLYNKHVFQPFRNHESFHDIIQNIDLVITYFSKKLEKEEDQSNDVDEILEKVQRWSLQWPRDLMKKFPDLKFKYVEEEKPEEFFIPYVWSLVGKLSGIYWDASLYKL